MQGDIFFRLKTYIPNYEAEEGIPEGRVPGRIEAYDAVVLSQSCDLVNPKKLPLSVMVCPIYDLEVAAETNRSLKEAKIREEMRRGHMPGHHMLDQCDLAYFPFAIQVAFFHQVFCVPFSYIGHLAESREPRLRLLSPYREHLGQAFARFVMRVGLPQDIPKFR